MLKLLWLITLALHLIIMKHLALSSSFIVQSFVYFFSFFYVWHWNDIFWLIFPRINSFFFLPLFRHNIHLYIVRKGFHRLMEQFIIVMLMCYLLLFVVHCHNFLSNLRHNNIFFRPFPPSLLLLLRAEAVPTLVMFVKTWFFSPFLQLKRIASCPNKWKTRTKLTTAKVICSHEFQVLGTEKEKKHRNIACTLLVMSFM